MEWKNIYRGMIMGVSDIVPGVSGGTIAVILGIYDQLIAAINGLFSKEWRKHFLFLLPLGIGVGAAIFLFSHLMKWLLANHEAPTYFLFLGLIIGILPYLFRESNAKSSFKWYHYAILAIGVLLISQLQLPVDDGTIIENKTLSTYVILLFSGFLASAAMILPGISGSFVLVVLGMYETIIQAVSEMELDVILVVGIGIFIGIIVMSKIIQYFLTHFRTATFALIIGFVIGSVYVIFPGWTSDISQMLVSVAVFAIGLLLATVLGKIEY